MTKTCNTRSCRTSRIWGAGKILLIVYIVWLSILCYFCVYGRCLARDLLCFHYCFFFLFYHAVATAANKDVYITEENSHHSSPQSPWQGAYCRCKNLLHNLNQFHMLRNTKLRSMLTKGGDETQIKQLRCLTDLCCSFLPVNLPSHTNTSTVLYVIKDFIWMKSIYFHLHTTA